MEGGNESWVSRALLDGTDADVSEAATHFWRSTFGISESEVGRGTNATVKADLDTFEESAEVATDACDISLLDGATPGLEISAYVALTLPALWFGGCKIDVR